jgi:NADH-quinone oxidoreductase subunit E
MKVSLRSHGYDEPDIATIGTIIEGYGRQKRKLIAILQDVQREYGYLPRNALFRIAEELGLKEIEVFSVATFYKGFSLEPKGEHVISLCLGTACHVRGAPSILEDVERLLNVKAGNTTEDLKFTLETVNCLGACAIGPVVVIDGQYHGQMNVMKTRELLKEYGVKTSEEVPEQVKSTA